MIQGDFHSFVGFKIVGLSNCQLDLFFRPSTLEPKWLFESAGKVVTVGPGSSQWAVELWISGEDVLLVQEGDFVRLHFEGWTAVST